MTDNKSRLLLQLQQQVETEAEILQKSLESAAEAATHPESKPENKYDTRGLEASYLAGAQKERLMELKGALIMLKNLVLRDFQEDDKVAPTALVELDHEGQTTLCFLLAWGAGYSLEWQGRTVLTVTPASPLGRAVLGKSVGDTVKVKTTAAVKEYEILAVL